jgi:preprotein translocase subunit YajC
MESWLTSLLMPLVAQANKGPAQAPPAGFDFTFFLPMILIGVLFYFLIMRPERKRRAGQQEMLKQLKKNDHVVTIGGIYGTVVNVQENSDTVTIRVDENTNAKLRVRRSAISSVVKDDETGEKADGDK